MPITNNYYANPVWVNGSAPALSASELNDMSATLQNLDAGKVCVGETQDGVSYAVTNAAVKPVTIGTGAYSARGKGQTIVFVPKGTSTSTTPTLAINGGTAYEIRIRGAAEAATNTSSPQIGLPGPRANWLLIGVPYLLTFCGKYWLVDSYIYDQSWRDYVLDNAMIKTTASGQIAHTDIGANGIPVKALQIDFSSDTAINSVTLTQCGKNLIDPSRYTDTPLSTSVTAGYIARGAYLSTDNTETDSYLISGGADGNTWLWTMLPAGTYTIVRKTIYANSVFRVACAADYPVANTNANFAARYDGNYAITFTAPAGTQWIGFQVSTSANPQTVSTICSGVMLFVGAPAATIDTAGKAAAAFEAYNGQSWTISFPSAYYQGRIDALAGTVEPNGGDAFSVTPISVSTMLGANNFFATDSTVTCTTYCDATLAYQALQSAIQA